MYTINIVKLSVVVGINNDNDGCLIIKKKIVQILIIKVCMLFI